MKIDSPVIVTKIERPMGSELQAAVKEALKREEERKAREREEEKKKLMKEENDLMDMVQTNDDKLINEEMNGISMNEQVIENGTQEYNVTTTTTSSNNNGYNNESQEEMEIDETIDNEDLEENLEFGEDMDIENEASEEGTIHYILNTLVDMDLICRKA